MKKKHRKHLITEEASWGKRILKDDSDFTLIESFNKIRTNIIFSMPKTDGCKLIAVTSSIPGEGKTTTTINLSITFAKTGAKVLIIDCDLRKSRIHRYLELTRDAGISDAICGTVSLEDVIKPSGRENLDVITAGVTPPNPAELLGSEGFAKILEELKGKYEYIFIDTPPVTVVADATIIAEHVAGAVIVTRRNVSTYNSLDVTVEALKSSNTKVLGFVLLDSDKKKNKYYGNEYADKE